MSDLREQLARQIREALGEANDPDLPVVIIVRELATRIAALEARIHEAKEIYTGMDGFIPETAPEGYQQRILRQMWDALKGDENE